MGIIRYVKLEQLSAKDKRNLKNILKKQEKALREAWQLAERGLRALEKKGKSRKGT